MIRDNLPPSPAPIATSIKAIVLDLDGTLYLPNRKHEVQAAKQVTSRLARLMPGSLSSRFVDLAKDKGLHSPHFGREMSDLNRRARAKMSADGIKPDHELQTALQECADRGIELLVFTQSNRPWTDSVLQNLDIARFFKHKSDHVITEQDGPFVKSQPFYYTLVERRLPGVPLDQVVMIDDRAENLQAAKQAGLRTALRALTQAEAAQALDKNAYIDTAWHDLPQLVLSVVRYGLEDRSAAMATQQALRHPASSSHPAGLKS
jgi:FMN phosphatase YigB (HAD superfamily)